MKRKEKKKKKWKPREIQVDANGRPLFFLHCFPTPALFLQRVQLSAHQLTLSRALDRPCSKFELESRATYRFRGMQQRFALEGSHDPSEKKERKKKKQTLEGGCGDTG